MSACMLGLCMGREHGLGQRFKGLWVVWTSFSCVWEKKSSICNVLGFSGLRTSGELCRLMYPWDSVGFEVKNLDIVSLICWSPGISPLL